MLQLQYITGAKKTVSHPAESSWKMQRDACFSITNKKIKLVNLKGSNSNDGTSVYSSRTINTNTHKNDTIRWSIRVLKNCKAVSIALVNSCKCVNGTFLKQRDYYGISCLSGNKRKNDSN